MSPCGPASAAQLWDMWRLLLDHLLMRMKEEHQSAAIMDVVRRFLKDNSILFDHAHKLDPESALQYLANADLPFPHH